MENRKLRDNHYFDVCRLCLELNNKAELISVNELGDVLFKLLPDLDLQLTINPQVCNSCSKIIISSYNFRCRSTANQEIIRQFITSNNLEHVDLKNMMREKNAKKETFSDSFSHPYYEICDTEVVETSIVETKYDQASHCKNEVYNVETTEDLDPSKEDVMIEECIIIEDDVQYNIQDNLVESTSSNYEEVSMEKMVLNWFSDKKPESDFKKTEHQSKKVKVEIISDVQQHHELKNPKKTSIKSEIQNYYHVKKIETVNESGKEIKCFQCNYLCLSQQDLTDHIKACHVVKKVKKEGKFSCSLCKNKFNQKLHLDGHLLNKHSDVPYVLDLVSSKLHFCAYCPYKTINNFNLKNHLEIKHKKSNKKKVIKNKCPHCPYTSRNQGNLKTHRKSHTDHNFPCCYCDKSFAQKINLFNHYLNYHVAEIGDNINEIITNQIYTCPKCQWRTMIKKKYIRHVRPNSVCWDGVQEKPERKLKVKDEALQNDIFYEIVS